MRELFEGDQADNPVEAARRAVRPVLRRRFYKTVTIAAGENGHAVHLDGKPVRTPARRLLAVPVPELARALADEWAAQGEHIDPAKMPLTRLANTILDGVAAARGQVAAEIRKYLATDLLFYRADAPSARRGIQGRRQRRSCRATCRGAQCGRRGDPGRSGSRRRLAARCAPCGDDTDRLGAARARFDARRYCRRGRVGGRACRRRLEHGAMGQRRDRAAAPRFPLC